MSVQQTPRPDPLTRALCDRRPFAPCPARFNMARYVMEAGRATPDKIALTVLSPGGEVIETWSFAALDAAIRETAAGFLARGLRPGERVLLRLQNSSAFPILFFGVIAAGGIAVATSAQLSAPEVATLIADADPRFLLIADALGIGAVDRGEVIAEADWPTLRQPAVDYADTRADDPAYLIYTSGTSGMPKGVLHAHRAAWARRMMWRDWYGLGPDDRMLHAGAFNWTYTLGTGLTDPWAAGASSLIMAAPPDAHQWPGLIGRHHATIFAAVPGIYRRILARAAPGLIDSLRPLRHALTAGERMPPDLAQRWQQETGTPVYEALGMSEISTFISSGPTSRPLEGACGRPQQGRRVAVLEGAGIAPLDTPGALAVARDDPGLMLGYWRRPEETAAAFTGDWFLTGDRVRMDAEGYVTHLGRSDDVMTASGYRVSPVEVEDALSPHPAVAEVAVTEVAICPDLTLIAAFIVPAGDWPGEDALVAFAEKRLARYKIPRIWRAVDSLPRTANGKLQRRLLAAQAGGPDSDDEGGQ